MANSAVRILLLQLLLTRVAWAGETPQVACVTPVDSYSNRSSMLNGDFSANVAWHDVVISRNTIGYGSAGGRAYELTVDRGRLYRVRPNGQGSFEVRHDAPSEEGAVMLQLATPSQWVEVDQLESISSFDDLNFLFDELVEDLGCGEDAILPFRIEGHINQAYWSLDTLPGGYQGHATDQDVTLVGIYSRQQKKRLFMVPGYNLHAHLVLQGEEGAGHLRELELVDGARLYLPKRLP